MSPPIQWWNLFKFRHLLVSDGCSLHQSEVRGRGKNKFSGNTQVPPLWGSFKLSWCNTYVVLWWKAQEMSLGVLQESLMVYNTFLHQYNWDSYALPEGMNTFRLVHQSVSGYQEHNCRAKLLCLNKSQFVAIIVQGGCSSPAPGQFLQKSEVSSPHTHKLSHSLLVVGWKSGLSKSPTAFANGQSFESKIFQSLTILST